MKELYKISISMVCFISIFLNTTMVFCDENENQFKTGRSYAVFFNDVTDDNIKHLLSYDLLILEPNGVTDSYRKLLKSNDKLLFGYMSTLEIEHYDEFKLNKMAENDYLRINDMPVFIERYQNYLGDIRTQKFKDILLLAIEERIIKKGYQGVFLDTADYTEYFDDESLNEELQLAYIEFLKELSSRYPKLLIFQNRGFESYIKGGSVYVDYLLYEDFKYDKILNSPYYWHLTNRLNEHAKANKGRIYALSQENEEENKWMSEFLGWPYYYCDYETNYSDVKLNQDNKFSSEKDKKQFVYFVLRWILDKKHNGE